MGRLKTVKPRVQLLKQSKTKVPSTKERRTSGRKLQERRLKLWSKSPCCAECGRLTNYPSGFELDHVTPLHMGGQDTEGNCQILCAGPDGCHAKKTAKEAPRA